MIGLFPANAVGDDIEVYADDSARACAACSTTSASRASTARACPTGRSPTSSRPRTPVWPTTSAAFAVTAGLGSQDKVKEFKEELDDYSAILLESLADRLAEAFAERLHERVRTELWGYAPDEHLDNEELIKEKYDGHPPGSRLPGLPRPHREGHAVGAARRRRERRDRAHREHGDVAGRLGERLVLLPPAVAVLRRRPASGKDQVEDYAKRKGWSMAEAERWLSPNLGYEPED